MSPTRRSVLAGAGGLAVLAGCLSEPDDGAESGEERGRSGYAAFFALWDWSEQVGGDAFGFENPVGVGEAGHGWSPDQGLTGEAADTDAFVYLDSPEFAWAQDVASQLEDDYDDVAVIDAMAGLESELLPWEDGHDHADHDHGSGDHGEGEDHEGDHENDNETGDHSQEGGDNHSHEDGDHDHSQEGDDNHSHEGADDSHSNESDHEEGNHTDGGASARHDPHVWVDPVLAEAMVGTIAEGLAEVDPDNAETYEDNAAEYGERIAGVGEAFEELVASADREVAVLAGHDSFRYVEDRYGFELHTPVSASPEESPSAGEIAGTIEVIEEEGIDTVLYDPFEAPEGEVPPLAETIVENSPATETAPVTPAAGTTAEWDEEGWGWVEQLEEVTLPSLRQALGVE
ncbi:metal ABC transporter substrate-binding protein [Saliphagus sp. LR7]|uniref:metal ABC transporter substrate-binding protein n=1 Tax=Saliphagus sp. LR7 TaxID=2282654 RepID=UPI000DF8466F|nr:metal ABC transporter substrate-binding protein [Saliphagus sp. LR7]